MPEIHEHNRNEKTMDRVGSPKYWLTLEQWQNDPEFKKVAEAEFKTNPLSSDDGQDGWARREFLRLMGASMALTTFGCVRRPAQKIIPYVKRPHEVMEGIANYYSSSFVDGGEAFGLIVKTREGRPIKVEGNPAHPINGGGVSARALAHILNLYDPDRLAGPKRNLLNEARTNKETVGTTWEKLDTAVVESLKKGGVALLTSSLASPSARALVRDFSSAVGAQHFTWEPICYDYVREGQKQSYGTAVIPRYRFDQAKMIVAVEADFLGTYLSSTEYNVQFAKGRKPGPGMNKLVAFESLMSLTGANADVRVRIKPAQQLDVLMGLLYEIVIRQGFSRFAGDGAVKAKLSPYADTAKKLGIEPQLFTQMAKDLWQNRGAGVVVAGGMATQNENAVAVQVAANFLNSVLENDGATIDYRHSYTGFQGSCEDLQTLMSKMKAGQIKTLIIRGVNPIYALPAASGFKAALAKVPMVVYVGDRLDESAQFCEYVAAESHPMESWGDMDGLTGVYSIQQPMKSRNEQLYRLQ